MNFAAQETPALSHREYLEGEQRSDIRHEYLAGQVFAMAGAGENHNRISLNIAFHLRAATRGKPCGVFISDMKLRVEQNDAYYYPDVMLTCDPADSESLYKRSPCLVVEVLSPSTEAIDRREKLMACRHLPSLRYYLLVAQEKRQVECYMRDAENRWRLTVCDNEGEGALEIVCGDLKVNFSLDDIYEDVRL
jgi:Uma2 family endonuclease